ncbi:MAG: UbiD family decarboxylase [Candidatus Accumulibacter sp.]|jgi:2,5-furandicarboxylate decarboxylase 1|nr:UbiD family decarboxylase [Accumulibacter sp.]
MDYRKSLEKLAREGRLARVRSEVDPVHELAGIARAYEGGKAVLFEKVKGSEFPLSIGLWWNRDNLASLFGVDRAELPFLFSRAMQSLSQDCAPPVIVENAPAQEIVMDEVDLGKIPVPTFALQDGGPYFSNCVVIARDPDTGVRNTSIHRLMVKGKDRLGLLMDIGRHLRDYHERAEARGEPLEITINNGVDAAYYVAAITPSAAAPIDVDELGVASYLLGEPARLCRSKTVAPEGIADAQLIMEAEILPHVREPEGPFGEVSGYYAARDDRWVVRVKAITHCRNPIVSALLPGKEVWNSVGLGVEANIFQTVSRQVKGLKKVYMTHGGSHYHVIIQIDPPIDGLSKNAILATFAAFAPLQMVTAVNSDVDIEDPEEVERALATRCDPARDVIIIPGARGHELNPVTDGGFGAKMGFDCTYPVPKDRKYEKVTFRKVNLGDYEIV